MNTGWRLGVMLVLLGATAAVLYTAPPVTSAVNHVAVYAVSATLGSWSGAEGVPEEILPIDPSERISLRRTYRDGDRIAWVSVALFVGQDSEVRRPSINKVFPMHSVSHIEPIPFAVPFDGLGTKPIVLPAAIVHQDSRNLFVAYWHQIGHDVYGSDYMFRLALMHDMVLARRGDSMLIRIATPARSTQTLAPVERLASELYSQLGGRSRLTSTFKPNPQPPTPGVLVEPSSSPRS